MLEKQKLEGETSCRKESSAHTKIHYTQNNNNADTNPCFTESYLSFTISLSGRILLIFSRLCEKETTTYEPAQLQLMCRFQS